MSYVVFNGRNCGVLKPMWNGDPAQGLIPCGGLAATVRGYDPAWIVCSEHRDVEIQPLPFAAQWREDGIYFAGLEGGS